MKHDLTAMREAVATMTEGPWVVDPQFGLDIVRAVDIGKPHGGGATPELDARYAWVIATVRADWPFDGCEAFTRRKFKGQQEPEADAAGIVALRNAAPALLDEVERVRAEHEYQLCEAQRWAGRAEQAEAEVAALKTAPCPCCGAMAEDYVKGRCLDVDNDPGVFTSGEPHD